MSARFVLLCATGVLLVTGAVVARAQQEGHPRHGQHAQHGGHVSPSRPSEEEEHGPPEGWKFTWPAGDPGRGREVFAKLECFKCHEVRGESFPGVRGKDAVGPELSQMAAHHPPEFFAESIINPNAVIDEDPGYKGPDGSSKMPSFNEAVTVQEVIDLVAYLVSLKPPGAPAAGGHAGRGAGPPDAQDHGAH